MKLPDDERKKILFSADNKEDVRLRLRMTKEALNVTMYTLRKKGFLTYNSVPPQFALIPDRILEYVFIEEEESDDNRS